MYKLKHFRATNFIGFMSGLGRKHFELDFSEMLHRDIFIILGQNATGKTTFVSLVPPTHMPILSSSYDFIIEKKEGILIRDYIDKAGAIIRTKIVYSPKKSGGHEAKAFIGIVDNDDNYIEMNANGNIKTYYVIIDKYFKVNADSLKLTYYSEKNKGLIDLTASERKASIMRYIPNSEALMQAYMASNDKYKILKNNLKTVSKRLSEYRDEDKLESSLTRVENYINEISEAYEKAIKILAAKEREYEMLTTDYHEDDMLTLINELNSSISKNHKKLRELGELEEIENIDKLINDISNTLFEVRVKINNSPIKRLKSEYYTLESELDDLTLTMNSEDIEDIGDLQNELNKSNARLRSLKYSKNPSKYDGLHLEEAEGLDTTLYTVDSSLQALLENHGEYFSSYFRGEHPFNMDISAEINKYERKISDIRQELYSMVPKSRAYDGMLNLKHKLELRPSDCTIDSCKFIAEALKWNDIEPEYEKFKEVEANLNDKLAEYESELTTLHDIKEAVSEFNRVVSLLDSLAHQLKRYLGVSLEEIKEYLKSNQLHTIFNYKQIRDVISILHEKELYLKLKNETIPDLTHRIQMASIKSSGIEAFNKETSKIKSKLDKIAKEIDEEDKQYKEWKATEEELTDSLGYYENLSIKLETRDELLEKLKSDLDSLDKFGSQHHTICAIKKDIEDARKDKDKSSNLMTDLIRDRDMIKFELSQVKQLKVDLAELDTKFIIHDILADNILKPSKGISKELISIYMDEILEVANMLLSKTFKGTLRLEDLDIEDKDFNIPYSYNGIVGADITYASSAQQSNISICLSLAIIANLIDSYGIMIYDEPDKALSPENKADFINILSIYTHIIGITHNFIITHSPQYYEGYEACYILFPGANLNKKKGIDYIEV
jgi:DNA repair exonuclease SbcCD ATPase subunit